MWRFQAESIERGLMYQRILSSIALDQFNDPVHPRQNLGIGESENKATLPIFYLPVAIDARFNTITPYDPKTSSDYEGQPAGFRRSIPETGDGFLGEGLIEP